MIFKIIDLFATSIFDFLQGMHKMAGAPGATWEYALAAVSVAIVLWVFYLAIRMTIHPGEDDPDHIKRTILDDEPKSERKSENSPPPQNRK
jgi:hypothetical protein